MGVGWDRLGLGGIEMGWEWDRGEIGWEPMGTCESGMGPGETGWEWEGSGGSRWQQDGSGCD